ncbi:MAG: serine/threonine-protein kinase [Vicinamibacteria bacterium]|nr:serine/threonine-protein kinase [Vicinamibacteria bacterium]
MSPAFEPGVRLGPYEIVAAIGAGGMGEVLRARDTKLGREVAIKVLPAAFAQDSERVARFRREAQILAALHHPNIASIFGLEEEGATLALAMELVEGEDLSQRLKRGEIPVDEALEIAKQIAEALEEAHEKGIVHRDLKPANVKVTADGKVKVLDFGLAKAFAADPMASSGAHDLSQSPTLATAAGTQAGVILGTAAYMSPEQARGRAVDRRADIWAFGVVLFEMLSGQRLFAGETLSDTLAAVLTREIDWTALPANAPPVVERLLRRCLERDAKLRLRDVGEVRIELARRGSEGTLSSSGIGLAPAARGPRRWPAALALVAAAAVASAAATWLLLRRPAAPPSAGLTAFGVAVPEGRFLARSQSPLLDLSADGRTLVFVAEGEGGVSAFARSVDRLDVRRIAGTEGAEHPALSPDGRWLAFFAGGQLRKVPIEGGSPLSLAEGRGPRGLAWMPDGTLVYAPAYATGLWRVAGTGGGAKQVTTPDGSKEERSHRWPAPLPGGRTVLMTIGVASRPGDYDDGDIDAVDLESGKRKTVLQGARMARYSATGHLVFQRRRALLAVAFDPDTLETEGEPFVLHEDAGGEASSGAGYFAVSDTGTLAFAPEASIPGERWLVLVDREGRETDLAAPPAPFNNPRFSPDGRRLAFAQGSAAASDDDIFVMELASQRVQRLTFGQGHGAPLWFPDGRRIAYLNGRRGKGVTGLVWKAADGSGEENRIADHPSNQYLPASFLPDGRIAVTDTGGAFDTRIVEVGTGKVETLRAEPAVSEYAPAFSPDGKYVAYTSSETGQDEVFVETYPMGGGKWQISSGGGNCASWSRDGREMYFALDEALYAVSVDRSAVFQASAPRLLFKGTYDLRLMPVCNYDVSPDGRFALVKRRFVPGRSQDLAVFLGWPSLKPRGGAR